jgi:hypothetical protein
MARMDHIPSNNTVVMADDNGRTCCILYETKIVSWDRDKIVLNTSGYETATTITRMNQVANVHRLGYRVYKRKGRMYVWHLDNETLFLGDTLTLDRHPAMGAVA